MVVIWPITIEIAFKNSLKNLWVDFNMGRYCVVCPFDPLPPSCSCLQFTFKQSFDHEQDGKTVSPISGAHLFRPAVHHSLGRSFKGSERHKSTTRKKRWFLDCECGWGEHVISLRFCWNKLVVCLHHCRVNLS